MAGANDGTLECLYTLIADKVAKQANRKTIYLDEKLTIVDGRQPGTGLWGNLVPICHTESNHLTVHASHILTSLLLQLIFGLQIFTIHYLLAM